MDDHSEVVEAAEQLAAAIARRDLVAIKELLAPGFVHRTHYGAGVDAEAFIRAITQIPGEITRVSLEHLQVDMCANGAFVTGVQHAQVLVDEQIVDDRRGFVDWFVRHEGAWRIQAAVDFPEQNSG